MKHRVQKLMPLLLALVMLVSLAAPALATGAESFDYDGDDICFIKDDGSNFGMFTPQDGTTCVISGDNVVIHFVPKNTTVYNAIHWGAIDDAELTKDVEFNSDGTFDITRPKTDCGKAYPVAPVKTDGTGTTASQYYLAIPAAEKLSEVTPVAPFDYDGDDVCFIKDDGSNFGMFTPQDGTTCVVNGDSVVIHFVPKNTTVYNAIHWGAIDDAELTGDVEFNSDGSFDITRPKTDCGKAYPVAPVKADGTGTTASQYYLAIPAAEKLSDVTPVEPFDYDGDDVTFIKADGDGFGMFAPQEGTTCVVSGDSVVIHYVPKNTTVYNGIHWGAIDDETLTKDVEFNSDGSFDIIRPKTDCGKAIPIAPIKVSDGGTTASQYYLAIPAADKLEDVTPVGPFDYDGDDVTFIKDDGSGFGMFAPQEGTTCVIDGDSVVIHYVPKNTTVYNGIHWGAIDDEALTKDVEFNSDGSFDITRPKTDCGKAIPIAPIKVSDGGTTASQYYLAIPAADKLDDVTPEPGPEPATRTDLAVTNNTGMFKVYSAYLESDGGETTLVVALTGTTYHYLIKGTYFSAASAGDQRDSSWLTYTVNAEGKYEFRIPIAAGENYIPIVSVSQTYLDAYDRGENPIERAFYPRQFELNESAATLTTGDYDDTLTFSVSSLLDSFKVSSTALTHVIGGPNSNNFSMAPVLQMLDDTYDQVTYPTTSGGAATTETAALSGGAFTLDMHNAKNVAVIEDGKPISLEFRIAATGETVEFFMTIDLLSETITIDGEEPEIAKDPDKTGKETVEFADVAADAYYADAVDWAVAQGITDGVTETSFAPESFCTRAQTVTFLWRYYGCPKATISNPFTDVKESDYFYEAVLWAVENGVTDGVTETSFAPYAECSRLQAVTFMWRAANKPVAAKASSFTDVTEGADAVNWAVAQGITDGVTETSFAPTNSCKRAHIVTFLYRADKA